MVVDNTSGTVAGTYDLTDVFYTGTSIQSATLNGSSLSLNCSPVGPCLFTGQTVPANGSNTYVFTVEVLPSADPSWTNTVSIGNFGPSTTATNTSDTVTVDL